MLEYIWPERNQQAPASFDFDRVFPIGGTEGNLVYSCFLAFPVFTASGMCPLESSG